VSHIYWSGRTVFCHEARFMGILPARLGCRR